MTIKSKLTILSLLVAVLATSFATVSAHADEGEEIGTPTNMQQMASEALENGDYDTVANLYLEHTGNELSESQFQVMQEAHNMMQEAQAMVEEAGIEMPRMEKFQKMKGNFLENLTDEQKEILEQAKELREAGDLEGAKELLEDAEIPLPPKGLQEKFHKNCVCQD